MASHDGRCRFPHGHNYQADVTVFRSVSLPSVNDRGPERGMVIDFSKLDAVVKPIIDLWDHAFMVEDGDPMRLALEQMERAEMGTMRIVVLSQPPTAENIARALARLIDSDLGTTGLHVLSVAVHEGPKSVATWTAS